METKTIEDAVEGIMNSEPMKRVLSVESTAVVTGRVGEYKGKFIQDVLQETLTSIAEQSKREERNSYKFDIEGKMYLTKELVKHIEHAEKLNASFERGRVDAFEEMLQTLT